MKMEDLKPLRGLLPGWSIYNKRVRGADYTTVGCKYYPELYEPVRMIGASIPLLYGLSLGEAIFGVILFYLVYSSMGPGPLIEYSLLREEKFRRELRPLQEEFRRVRELLKNKD